MGIRGFPTQACFPMMIIQLVRDYGHALMLLRLAPRTGFILHPLPPLHASLAIPTAMIQRPPPAEAMTVGQEGVISRFTLHCTLPNKDVEAARSLLGADVEAQRVAARNAARKQRAARKAAKYSAWLA